MPMPSLPRKRHRCQDVMKARPLALFALSLSRPATAPTRPLPKASSFQIRLFCPAGSDYKAHGWGRGKLHKPSEVGMIPAPDYSHIELLLNQEHFSIGHHHANGIPARHNVVGFVFFDQSIKRPAVSDFLDNLSLLNEHSGELIHFFLPGISLFGPNSRDNAVQIGKINGNDAYHNTRAFMSFKIEFEQKLPQWQYDFGVELVMMDVIEIAGKRHLDFDSAVFIKVEEFIRLKIIDRTTELFTKIIRFRRESKLMTARDTKIALQTQFGVNWFKGLVLAMFPRAIQDLARAQAVLGGGSALR